MSQQKRRSTVHDLTSLRLHPDGSRVINSESNLQPRKAKHATKDARGNWIAQDAGGTGRILTRLAAKKAQDQAGEVEEEGGMGSTSVDKGKGKATGLDGDSEEDEYIPKDTRAKKRKVFANDLAFLGSPGSSTHHNLPSSVSVEAIEETVPESILLPQPSSDLLKCIHHFASNYYTEMGQLRDSSREYRQEKKRRKLLRARSTSTHSRQRRSVADDREESSQSSSVSSDEETKQREVRRNKDKTKASHSGALKGISSKAQASNTMTDMYKVCDGSALMAIGMLLQQHVADLLSPRIPEGWEDAMIEHGEIPLADETCARSPQEVGGDVEEEASRSNKSEEETEDDALMDLVNSGLGDEDYVPS